MSPIYKYVLGILSAAFFFIYCINCVKLFMDTQLENPSQYGTVIYKKDTSFIKFTLAHALLAAIVLLLEVVSIAFLSYFQLCGFNDVTPETVFDLEYQRVRNADPSKIQFIPEKIVRGWQEA